MKFIDDDDDDVAMLSGERLSESVVGERGPAGEQGLPGEPVTSHKILL